MKAIVQEHNYLDADAARQAARMLKSLLETTPYSSSIPTSDERLGSLPLVDSIADVPAQPIVRSDHPIDAWAVDGGSATIGRIGRIEIIAWRGGMVRFFGHRRTLEICQPPDILAYDRLESERLYSARFSEWEPSQGNGAARPDLAGGLRWLAEWRLVEQVIAERSSSEDDCLLLIDGSLRGNADYGLDKQMTLLQQAAAKKIHLLAVSKQTTLTVGGPLPLDVLSEKASGESDGARTWYRRLSKPLDNDCGWLGDVYLMRLHPAADKVYRVDVNRYDSTDPAQVFSWLAALADDIEFCGYPYPLAAAHRLARIDGAFKNELIDSLGRALEREGMSADIWEAFLRDSHGQLNADLEPMIRSI
ncbi:MAG: hypothetical protein PHR28_12925 [candidate division Zixibacteria bacterium]|nr:hypothetical protein [candidate division Zixibacteria bacterium]